MINKLHYEISHDGIVIQVTYNYLKNHVHLESFCPADDDQQKDFDFYISLKSLEDLNRVFSEILSYHSSNEYLQRRDKYALSEQQQEQYRSGMGIGGECETKIAEYDGRKGGEYDIPRNPIL